MTTVRHAARALSRSLMPSLRKDFFQASMLETSATLSETTLMLQTTPACSPGSGAAGARGSRRRKTRQEDMVRLLRDKAVDDVHRIVRSRSFTPSGHESMRRA